MNVALVTGSSSGIGQAVAERFRSAGWTVVGFSRREGVDLTDDASVAAGLKLALERHGRIDVLVNNAGTGIFGVAEFARTEDIRRQFEVNFFAAVALTQKVLGIMRGQGGGRIVNVASAAALFPLPFQSYYTATKAALLAWSRSLAGEVGRLGIKVSAVCPGDVKTGFTAARTVSSAGDEIYGGAVERALRKAAASEESGMKPESIAAEVFACATARRPPLVAVPGLGYAWLDRLARLLPRTLVSRLITRFYT